LDLNLSLVWFFLLISVLMGNLWFSKGNNP
jgi:hypothetical protein